MKEIGKSFIGLASLSGGGEGMAKGGVVKCR